MAVCSRGWALYMMPIIDAEHPVKEIYFTLNREAPTTLSAFDKYWHLYETQTSKKIKQVRFDNEFAVPKEWTDYCNKYRIHIEPTIPYLLQMNGISERAICTITDDIHMLLIELDLPKSFWVEAAAYSVYTCNLIPSSTLPGKIPLEGWMKKRINISHLCTFGCKVHVKVLVDTNRCQVNGGSKLDKRTLEGTFISYLQGHGGY